ncbi:MAG: S8 family serine peptidase [Flavobacterium sp.]|uniref:S8 family serine peptidase n=1 Tax=Flavobacterium sp. TaxID=239 RepID=UPI002734E891|nr:S8 family serine peptidase [Flavobacterium sp.]MDP3681201.1 S8 family serine peptidase [Flavobacterium sp.]
MKKNTFRILLLLMLFFSIFSYSQNDKEKKVILNQTNVSNLKKLKMEFGLSQIKKYEKAVAIAKQNGWPVKFTSSDGTYSEIKEVTDDGFPLYRVTRNEGSAFTSRANKLRPNGGLGLNLTGNGLFVGVWDQDNAIIAHEDFGGRAFVYDNNTNPTSYHSSHVTGTMISSGANSTSGLGRGIAYQAYAYVSNWTRDLEEMTELATNNGLLLSNHSYGLLATSASFPEYIFGAYRSDSKDLDQIAFDAPYYQPVIAAGNDRNKTPNINASKDGFDLLTDFSTAKNAIVVAAVEGLSVNGYVNSSSVVMSNFSSWGPTDDNRIKPDISTKGVNVFSTTNAAGNKGYGTISGTSMAAPGVTGTLLLLQEHFRNLKGDFMRSATLRGLMIHSADEAGDADGPDPRFGWGLLNAEKAAILITNAFETNNKVLIQEFDSRTSPLLQGSVFTKVIKAKGTEPLVATISWTDRSGVVNTGTVDLATPVLVNDLDIRITKGNEVFFPWRLNDVRSLPAIKADNSVDNVEKIEINNPANDFYTITVNHKGSLIGDSQDFSLIVSGVDESTLSNYESDFKSLNVWPNPMNEFVNISVQSDFSDEMYLEVYDVLGIRQLYKKIDYSNNGLVNSINVDSLKKGVYIFKIKQGNKQSVWKILKN